MKNQFICITLLALTCMPLLGCAPKGATSSDAKTSAAPAVAYEAHVSAGGMVPAVADMKNPYANDADAAKNGASLFVGMNCDGCHGGDGTGWVGPSLADGRWRYGGDDAELFMSIFYGRPKGMPAFGGALSQEAIWTLVSYLKSLHAPATVPTQSFDGE
jgi:cbb3-type cytochrome c oxidase subunit III